MRASLPSFGEDALSKGSPNFAEVWTARGLSLRARARRASLLLPAFGVCYVDTSGGVCFFIGRERFTR